ncbi:beta strand repeat-containing protein, partial [Pseudoteredinibacter isoporae]
GSYTYTPGAGAAALAEGATATDTFSYTLKDNDGSFSTTTVTITVTGTTDGVPTITITDINSGATGEASVSESGNFFGATFTVTAPDGLDSLTIAGQTVTLAALNNASNTNIIDIATGDGVLTITNYNASTGAVSYGYNPDGISQDHNGGEIVHSIAIVVNDSDGTTASDTLDILVLDRAPVANADTGSTDADTNATGNVRTGAGADQNSADATSIGGVAAGTQTGDIVGGVGTAIVGSLGSLTIQPNGSYTYVPGAGAAALAEGETATDTFSYTLKDSDGSFSTTTVTITVTGTTDGLPTVTITDNNAGATGDESVQEDATLTGNTFTISAPDGLGSISVAGQTITAAALNNASTTNIAVNTSQGLLTITDYNSATGVVTYNYDPAGAAKDHTSGEVVDNIAVVVTDSDGTTANGTLDILITDTAPVANADTDSTDADTNTTGNVRTDVGGADVDGADAAEITGVVAGTQTGDIVGGVNTAIAGTLGSLTIQADGSYTYTPGAGAEALAEGATATDTFSYTLKDDDGSFSTTTVTITVTGTTDGVPTITIMDNNAGATGEASVSESGNFFGATFTVTAPDGLDSLTIAGQTVTLAALNNASSTNIDIVTGDGVLTITNYNASTGVVSYGYNPDGISQDHSSGEIVHSIAIVVNDSDGTTASDTLDILVLDRVPVANADTDSTDADTNATGNVRTGAGADQNSADATSIGGVAAGTQTGDIVGGVGTAIVGSLGSLTIQPNGSYTYVPGAGAAALAEGETATDTFSYTLKDSDGSFSTTTVTITVTGTTDGAPTVTITDNNAGATGDESVQEDATSTGNTFTINTPDGLGSISVAGQTITAAALNNASTSNIAVNTAQGVLTITDYNSATGVVTYNYAPAGTAKDHTSGEVVDNIAVVVTDSDGTTANGTLDILITDTAPVANADTDSTDADTNATGNVRTDVGGADVDGADAAEITGVVAGTQTGDISGGVNTAIAGTLGSLTIQADGSYTYTPGAGAGALAEGATATDTFSYTLKDDDGSFSTTTVTITVTGTTDGAPTVTITDNNAGATGDESVQEDETLTGNTFTISTPDGLGSLSIAGQSITAAALNNASSTNITVTTPEGVMTITGYNSSTGVVTYSYDPSGTAKDHSGGEIVDSLAVVVTDSDGTTANGTLDILITDTGPTANSDTATTSQETLVTIDVLNNDVFGADGAAATNSGVVAATVSAAQGTVTIASNGELQFTPANGFTGTATINYTIRDDDGTESNSTVEVDVIGVSNITNASESEGESLEHTVTLSSTTTADTVMSFTIGDAGDSASSSDYDASSLVFSNGVTYDAANNQITIPAGVTNFTVTVPSTEDRDVESDESYTLNIGQASANGTIENDDTDVTLTPTTMTFDPATMGLQSSYYGYNDNRTGSSSDPLFSSNGVTRLHSDDGIAGDAAGSNNNIDRNADVIAIVEGRDNDSTLVNSGRAGSAAAADVTFIANRVEYGFNAPGSNGVAFGNGIGVNPHVDAGGTISSGNLNAFLAGNASDVTVTTGLGRTTDGAFRMVGFIFLPAGNYDIRVRADDGYRVYLDGGVAAEADRNQGSRTDVYTNNSAGGGLVPIEILYWDQGGAATLRVEIKPTGAPNSDYQVLDTDDLPILTPDQAAGIPDDATFAQDAGGNWVASSGSTHTGDATDEDITGTAFADTIIGGAGEDIMFGGDGADRFVFRSQDVSGSNGVDVEQDVIRDFNASEDILDLSDLLNTAQNSGNLDGYLHFEVDATTGDILVHINVEGDSSSNTLESGKVDHVIRIENPDAAVFSGTDQQIIDNLLNNGALDTLL